MAASGSIWSRNVVSGTVTADDLEVDSGTLSVDATNNRVGVGVTDPDSTLEVLSTTTQQKWSYDADSFATLTVADASHTTIATGESGDLILDAADDIILDSHLGKWRFKRNGTMTCMVSTTSGDGSNMVFDHQISDSDYVFKCSDGGVGITALTLDASDAGAALFNAAVTVGTDLIVTGGDIQYGNGQNATMTIAATAHNAAGKNLTITSGATTAGTTNNIAGGSLTIQAGQGKGTGAGGDIIFQTANAGSSGSTLNSLATALTISDDLSSTFAGAIQANGNATFGVDDTGVDVRIYSATASEGVLYDASEDELCLLLTTKLKFHDVSGGEEIYASSDGHLEVNAGATLDITAPTVDINASTAVTIDSDTVTFASGNADDPLVIIKNTANDATGARLHLVKDKGAAGAANDFCGEVAFIGDDANQDQVTFGALTTQVKVHTNGQEGGKIFLSAASHDGELTPGLIIEDGDLEDELDVTIGSGTASVTSIAGRLGVGDTAPVVAMNVVHDYHNSTFENQLSDGQGGGEVLRYSPGANDTLTVGQVYFLHTDGTWDQCDADAVATGATQMLGIGLGNARTVGVLLKGFVRIPSTEILNTPGSGAVDGLPVYVSTTAGHLDFTAAKRIWRLCSYRWVRD
jgi:hypothetical protein